MRLFETDYLEGKCQVIAIPTIHELGDLRPAIFKTIFVKHPIQIRAIARKIQSFRPMSRVSTDSRMEAADANIGMS